MSVRLDAVRNWVIGTSVAAPVALIGGWTWAATRQPASYDSVHDTISALAARHAHDRWIMTTGLAVLGACHVLTAIGFPDLGRTARVLLALGGVAAIGVAAVPQPSDRHGPIASLTFLLLAIWPAFARALSRRTGLLVTGVLILLIVWLGVAMNAGEIVGVSERVLAGAEALVPLGYVTLFRLRSAD